jgi:hypothetical protein
LRDSEDVVFESGVVDFVGKEGKESGGLVVGIGMIEAFVLVGSKLVARPDPPVPVLDRLEVAVALLLSEASALSLRFLPVVTLVFSAVTGPFS